MNTILPIFLKPGSQPICQQTFMYYYLLYSKVQHVKNLPAMQETQETRVQSLGWEYPLEKELATHSSIVAWRILWTVEPGGLESWGRKESDTNEQQQY